MKESGKVRESVRARGGERERDATYNCVLMKDKQYSLRECVWARPKGSALLVS